MRKFVFAICIIFMLGTLHSCTVTTTRIKNPVFSVSTKYLQDTIKLLIVTQQINLDGTERKQNGKVSSDLTVRLINSQNAPTTEDERFELGKKIAKIMKTSLKDPNEYNTITVLYVVQKDDALTTKTNYTGQIYKTEEL